jgi:hypothetical protein
MSGKKKLEMHRARGGGTNENKESEWDSESKGSKKEMSYSGDNNVEKEAKERKKGGKVEKKDCYKHGGKVKEEHRVEGKMAKMHMGRPGRKSGGRVGSDKSPLTSAANASAVVGHSTDDR